MWNRNNICYSGYYLVDVKPPQLLKAAAVNLLLFLIIKTITLPIMHTNKIIKNIFINFFILNASLFL